MSKYYAVRKGKKVGVFSNWSDCEVAVKGFSGAEYKSFKTLEEAENYLRCSSPVDNCDLPRLYTCGIYQNGRVHFGVYIKTGEKTYKFCGSIDYVSSSGNIAGDIIGALAGIQLAKDLGINHLVLCHNYDGLQNWYTGVWKANSYMPMLYVDLVKKIGVSLEFNKVDNKIAKSLALKSLNTGNCAVSPSKLLDGVLKCQDVKVVLI